MTKRFSIEADLELSINQEKPALKPMHVIFDGNPFWVDLNREFRIDPHGLIDSMTEHAANYGWWAALLAMSRSSLRKKKAEYHQKIAGLDSQTRVELAGSGIKITEAAVSSAIESRAEVHEIAGEILPLEEFVEMAELILKSFENKRDMLKEINRAQTSDRINS